MNELALFAGAGGGILGGKLLGWRTVCAVEWEPYAACVLAARQNDGFLPPFPIWDDIQTFDGRPWQGIVDVVSGGFPCQDISAAGKGAGIDGERSGMWKEMARVICEVRPRFVFVENSPMLTSRGLGTVLGDLATMGFDAKWGVLGAADVGAPHQRDRIWIVANTNRKHDALRGNGSDNEKTMAKRGIYTRGSIRDSWSGCQKGAGESSKMAYTSLSGLKTRNQSTFRPKLHSLEKQSRRSGNEFRTATNYWEAEPNVGRVADGVAARVDRLKAIGNGQVPEVARRAWEILSENGSK